MREDKMLNYIKNVLENIPNDWLNLTTHRLDIYNEELAKIQFLEQFETLFKKNNSELSALSRLPTAFDYIRLGHPLSCILEWVIANLNNLSKENVISFSSNMIPILAVLRTNLLDKKPTQIIYIDELPEFFDTEILKSIYGYKFELKKIKQIEEISHFKGSTVFISQEDKIGNFNLTKNIDFFININTQLGSILLINGKQNKNYISQVQHVRRRETIAMTPMNTLSSLKKLIEIPSYDNKSNIENNKTLVLDSIKKITGVNTKALIASSGLSMQYAIVMGLVHDALENHREKIIKIIVPTNCYGGTNDQARRIADCIQNVEVMDLAVDDGDDMVQSISVLLDKIANEDAIAYIIAEIPTNPRVEVPDLIKLRDILSETRKTATGKTAIDPVFILDQTFCPNVPFLGESDIFSTIRAISYVSGSKFPSGGQCTAGYCVANRRSEILMRKIETHLELCDNKATNLQIKILAKELSSMNQRIHDAYKNTHEFVNFIKNTFPEAKINFVTEELAKQGFTPSVFSLDLPSKGSTNEEKESFKRKLNYQLIRLMIKEIPNESKFCVSYGQLDGCYWTIPATTTQGTTKESDKDYIIRVALSPNIDIELHKKVFLSFIEEIYNVN